MSLHKAGLHKLLGAAVLTTCLAAGSLSAAPVPVTHFSGVNTNSPVSMSVYGWLTFAGQPAPAGTEVAVYDGDGVLCGASGVDAEAGGAFLLQIYGDDASSTASDEGARAGEALRFVVSAPGWAAPIDHEALSFQSAGFNNPPVYPPVFEDKSSYGVSIDTGMPAAQ